MPKLKKLSLGAKLGLYFVGISCVLITSFFIFMSINKQQKLEALMSQRIEQIITLTEQQMLVVVKFFTTYNSMQKEQARNEIVQSVKELKHHLTHTKALEEEALKKSIKKKFSKITCGIFLHNENSFEVISKHPLDIFNAYEPVKKSFLLNQWNSIALREQKLTMCPTILTQHLYSAFLPSHGKYLSFSCSSKMFNKPQSLEDEVKVIMQKGFDVSQNIHKGKVYLMWANEKALKGNTKPLSGLDNSNNQLYCISKISNLRVAPTGDLMAKSLFEQGKVLRHSLFNPQAQKEEEALTWVRTIRDYGDKKLLLVLTAFQSDITRYGKSSVLNILPAFLLALLLALIAGFFMLRKLIRGISTLLNTAKAIQAGDLKVRSNLRGDDEMGMLGLTFDKMLNTLEKNIASLDLEVEKRTQELKLSLEEKETLLKEIHHRVKNNLALTINLIRLQQNKLEDAHTKEVLTDIQERIFTMELLHRKLYESKNLEFIPMDTYIKSLVQDLCQSYDFEKNVRLKLDLEPCSLNIEHALPCGLILNEAITNAFKYAFKNNKGLLEVTFKKEAHKGYYLCIKDSGEGLQNIELKTAKSLGLRLMYSIATAQLLGELSYTYQNGACFELRFTCEENA